MNLRIRPVTADRWDDLVGLFGPDRGISSCWCMWWRQTAAEFDRKHGAGNRRAMQALVRKDRVPGLLAYEDGSPVGWVAVAPRTEFGRIERSRVLGPVDDVEVWSVVCFYIRKDRRRKSVGRRLLRAAVRHAAAQGALVVEGYPVDARGEPGREADLYMGVPEMFIEAGFREVARRTPNRPIMRWERR